MARFIGYVTGSRNGTGRTGHAKSGLQTLASGAKAGVRVVAVANGDTDHFVVYATAGSGGGFDDRHIATVTYDPAQCTVEVTPEGEKELG